MPPQHVDTSLLRELEGHNAFFDDLVDMIPAKLYVAGNTGDEAYNPKYYKGQHKESKESRRARNKVAKRAKFDPAQSETTRQVKERKAREEEEADGSSNSDEDSSPPARTTPPPHSKTENSTPTPSKNASRIEALRAKLHAKLAEKRAQRPQTDASTVSKRAARRAEKQRRREEAKLRKKASTTQVHTQHKHTTIVTPTHHSTSSLSDDLQHMDFGKLAGLNPISTKTNNKSLANLNKKKNLEKMLADAEEKRKRLVELKQGSSEEKKKASQMLWKDTLKEASGERVKDDPSKLKKALKRRTAKKAKSAKAWKSRMEMTKTKMDERQKIRSHNIDKRKLGGSVGASLSKKRIVGNGSEEKKSSRRLSRAGFEGKKQEFLNQKQGKKSTTSTQQ